MLKISYLYYLYSIRICRHLQTITLFLQSIRMKTPCCFEKPNNPLTQPWSSYTRLTQRIFDVPGRISILLEPGPKSVNTCAFWQSFPFHFEIMVYLPSCVERPPTKWLGQWRCWSRGSLAQHQEAPNLRSPSSKASDGNHAGLNFNHS